MITKYDEVEIDCFIDDEKQEKINKPVSIESEGEQEGEEDIEFEALD
jgi:hypothetical protein